MLEILNRIDTAVFLFLNGLNNTFFDYLMYYASDRFVWIPFYAVLIYFIIRTHGRQSWLIILLVIFVITASDQISVFLKNYFERPRPCHQELLADVIHTVRNKCGGAYGFVSSHAANTFALAFYLAPFLKPRFRYFPVFIILWAGIISYSRIYLGVHFPGDVIFGALLGALIGVFFTKIYQVISSVLLRN
jgi:undecaprenyl-diphosphatase